MVKPPVIEKTTMHDDRWVRRPKPNAQARLRLFCFPYAGGAASVFRGWPEHLAPDIELFPIQLPGRENRIGEPLFRRLDLLVTRLTEVLLPFMDRPFAFYGHSMGTLIAFELARELRRRQCSGPICLLVSGRCAPHIPDPELPLHRLADDEFREGLRCYNGTHEAVLNNSELMELFVPLLRADFELCETYEYKDEAPLECPISAFAGIDEPCRDMLGEWRKQTVSDFDSELFSGDHFFLNTGRAKFVSVLSERLLHAVEAGVSPNMVDVEAGTDACQSVRSPGK